MNISTIAYICDNDCEATNIFSNIQKHSDIVKKTVRSKGQFMMQRFFYICGGMCNFVLNNNTIISASKGDILYLPSDITYECIWEDSDDSSAISIGFDLVCSGEKISLSDDMFIIANDKYGIYFKLFNNMAKTYTDGKIGYKIKCRSVLLEILYLLIPELIKTPGKANDHAVYKGILYIENNYMEKIDIDYISEMCSMSPSSFRSKFIKETGMSPIKYRNYLRIKKAAELLKTGEFTAQEAANRIGIDDVYYFNKMFKMYLDITPGKFKNILQTQGDASCDLTTNDK